MQVIIYTNENGGVSVCKPNVEMSIEEVKVKDTPEHSIIVDLSTLPESENDFFNAWELSGQTVSINITKAKAICTLTNSGYTAFQISAFPTDVQLQIHPRHHRPGPRSVYLHLAGPQHRHQPVRDDPANRRRHRFHHLPRPRPQNLAADPIHGSS